MALQPFVVTYRCPVPRCGEEILLPLDAPSEQAAWGPPGPHCFRHKMQTTKPVEVRRSWYLAAA